MSKQTDETSYEISIKSLEEITEKLKEGNMPLSDMLKLYEEGISHYKTCSDIIENAKQQIEVYDASIDQLRKDAD